MRDASRWLALVVVMSVGVAVGCRERVEPRGPVMAPPPRASTPSAEPALDRLAQNVVDARDAREEAEAIRQLWRRIASEQLTYELQTHDVTTDRRVASPAAYKGPLRAEVQIFRGREKVHEFTFIPKDNANLVLIGGMG